jgi:hypothetical protein
MWFQIELPEPTRITEILVDASVGGRGGLGRFGGRGRGGIPAGPLAAYRLQVSMDGTTWSEPVAEGAGLSDPLVITFPPVQAKFIRITQTGTPAPGPFQLGWAVQRVRIYRVNGKG